MITCLNATKCVPVPVEVTLRFDSIEELEDVVTKVGLTSDDKHEFTDHQTQGSNWYNFYSALIAAKKTAQLGATR